MTRSLRLIPVTDLKVGDVLWHEPGSVPDKDYHPTSLVTEVKRVDPGGSCDCVLIKTDDDSLAVDLPANSAVAVVGSE